MSLPNLSGIFRELTAEAERLAKEDGLHPSVMEGIILAAIVKVAPPEVLHAMDRALDVPLRRMGRGRPS